VNTRPAERRLISAAGWHSSGDCTLESFWVATRASRVGIDNIVEAIVALATIDRGATRGCVCVNLESEIKRLFAMKIQMERTV